MYNKTGRKSHFFFFVPNSKLFLNYLIWKYAVISSCSKAQSKDLF